MDNGFFFSGIYFILLVLRQYDRKKSLFYDTADGNKHRVNYLTGTQIFYKWIKGGNMINKAETHSGNILSFWHCVRETEINLFSFLLLRD